MVPSLGAQNRPLAQSQNTLNNVVSGGEEILEAEVLVSPRNDLLCRWGVLGVYRQCKLKCFGKKFFNAVVLEG